MVRQQKKDEPSPHGRRDGPDRPMQDNPEERGDYEGHVMRTSAYTRTVLHPVQTALGVALLGAGVAMALRGNRLPLRCHPAAGGGGAGAVPRGTPRRSCGLRSPCPPPPRVLDMYPPVPAGERR